MKKILSAVLTAFFILNIISRFVVAATAETPVNIAAGQGYTITTGEPISGSYGQTAPNGITLGEDNGRLTDSVLAGADSGSAAWYRAYSGRTRRVCFDFGADCSVQSLWADFLYSPTESIYLPRYINVYLSVNGTEYELVQEHFPQQPQSVLSQTLRADITLNRSYKARYVVIEYATDEYVFCGEVGVMGSKTLNGNERAPRPQAVQTNGGYPQNFNGNKHIVKLYNGHDDKDHTVGVLTESELLPYVAYINTAGEIAGKMFDAVLLAPCNADYFSSAEEWDTYFTHTFTPGQDLDALNKVVGRVYGSLGITQKLGVYLTVPFPTVITHPFGDINNDGVAEYSLTVRDRLNIVKRYVSKCLDEFENQGYDNLLLNGFFWQGEKIDYYGLDDEIELIQQVNRYIRRKGYFVGYSSGYLSPGFDSYTQNGFDGGVMQSYYGQQGWDGYFKQEMLAEFAKTLYSHGLGAEIGFSKSISALDADWDYSALCRNYEAQLYYGSTQGYMNGVNLYEQGIGPGFLYSCCYGNTASESGTCLRRAYDITYRYVNGNYVNLPPQLSLPSQIEITESDAVIPLKITDANSYLGDIAVVITTPPLQGKATVSADKAALIYSPQKGSTGEDVIGVTVTDSFGNSGEHLVKVIISTEASADPQPDISVAPPPQANGNESMPPWLLPMMGVLGGIMVLVAVVTIVKSKKK